MKKSKYWQTALLLNLLFLFGCFVPTQIVAQTTVGKKLTPREIAQQTLSSTVLIVMGNSGTKKIKSGSGFFVAEDIVATNFHVIKDTTEGYAKIYGQDKIYKILGTVGIDEKNDLALLKISRIKGKPLKLNTDDSIAIGDDVYAVGNPEGLEGTFSQGIVSSIRKTDKFNLLQITASISEGSSGGAVLNDKAEVVGVAVGAIESGQSLNFAIPISFLRILIVNIKSLNALSNNSVVVKTQPTSKNQQNQTKIISKKPQNVKNTNLIFGKPDETSLGKVKSITSVEYLLESKFDNWELGKMLQSSSVQYNSDGYEVFSETVINSVENTDTFNFGLYFFIVDYKINVDIFKFEESLPFSAKRNSYYDNSTSSIAREYYFKCSTCASYNFQTKIIIKYEDNQKTIFDSNGKILEKFIEQNDNGKVTRFHYDESGKLLSRNVDEPNGNTSNESYNQDGKVKYKSITTNNSIGDVSYEEWSLDKGILKLSSKRSEKKTETENEIITTTKYFSSQGIQKAYSISKWNKKMQQQTQWNYNGTNFKYEYEFDSAKNWIKMTILKEVTKFGESYFEPQKVITRKIIYY